MKNLLITGVSGFVGSHASRYFKAKGFRVIGMDSQPRRKGDSGLIDRYEQLTMPDKALEQILAEEKPEYCLHCAGGSSVGFSVEHPEEDFRSHVPVTYGLLNALRQKAPECRIIYISSAAVYGSPKQLPIAETAPLMPISPYGYHKMGSELIIRQFHELYGLKVATVRLFSAYGNGLRKQLLWDIYQKAKSQPNLELHGTGNETRDFIHISDIVRAFDVIFALSDLNADTYNLGGGVETTINKVAELMLERMRLDIPLVFKGDVRAGDPQNWRADIKRIQRLGYKPSVALAAGVNQYVNWCKNEQA